MRQVRPITAAMPIACSVVLLSAAECPGSSSPPPPVGHASSSSPAADTRSSQPVELSCADAGSGDASGAGDLSLAGLTLEGVAQPVDEVPVAPGGSGQRFRKVPTHLAAGAGPITVELIGPASGPALVWVPATEWSNRPELRRWMTKKVIFHGCPGRDVTYLGGVLASQSDRCLHLRVSGAGGRVESRQLRLDGRPC